MHTPLNSLPRYRGFSSTTGVHISLAKFNFTRLDAASKTAVIGAGARWSDVYAAVDGTGLNIVGGRNPAVGVAGFTLGGGEHSVLNILWLHFRNALKHHQ